LETSDEIWLRSKPNKKNSPNSDQSPQQFPTRSKSIHTCSSGLCCFIIPDYPVGECALHARS
jgi:hypothetical protein